MVVVVGSGFRIVAKSLLSWGKEGSEFGGRSRSCCCQAILGRT